MNRGASCLAEVGTCLYVAVASLVVLMKDARMNRGRRAMEVLFKYVRVTRMRGRC